jgi:UDP-N-acetylglucosamine 2-epimerase (non-hydrolysing)
MRDVTERPEAVDYGTALLVGTDDSAIVETAEVVLSEKADRKRSIKEECKDPFGQGLASQAISDALAAFLGAGGKDAL